MDRTIETALRLRLLQRICDGMTEEEKRLLVQRSLQEDRAGRVMQALQRQERQLDALVEHASRQSWLSDFGANIAGNAVFDGSVWVLSRLLRSLR